jgi:hypothetical protein
MNSLIIDYNADIQDVFMSVVKSVVSKTRSLNILGGCLWTEKCERAKKLDSGLGTDVGQRQFCPWSCVWRNYKRYVQSL